MAIRRTGSQTLVNRGVTAAAATPVNIITGSSGGGGATVNISSIQIANSTFVAKDDLAIDTAGGYMIINGTGFQSGAVVYIQGTAATSTAFVSSSRLNVTVPALSSGLLDVYVVNTDGSGSIYLRSLNANGTPSWTTTSTLTAQDAGSAFAINLVASGAAGDGTITYAVSSGSSLPSGTFLSSNGYFYGTISGIEAETTYSFSVDAIDAQNQETARSFNITVRVGDSNFKNTTLLINGETSNNVWITDISSNALTLTVNGDVKPAAFSPYRDAYSVLFNGSSDYLSIEANSAFSFGTGDFTIECFIKTGDNSLVGGYSRSIMRVCQIDFYLRITQYHGGTDGALIVDGLSSGSTVTLKDDVWHHVALVRESNIVRLWIDGIYQTLGSGNTNTTNYSNSELNVFGGRSNPTTGYFNGHISNLRIVKGTAVYTGTNNITVPTNKLTAVTNTSLLICNSNRLVDSSNNNLSISIGNSPIIRTFTPLDETDLITGSAYFDGTGDYLTVPNSGTFNFGAPSGNTNDFSIEFWLYQTNTTITSPVSTAYSAGINNYWMIGTNRRGSDGANVAGYLNFYLTDSFYIETTSGFLLNVWNHIVACRTGTTVSLFLNGIRVATNTTSINPSSTGLLQIGGEASQLGRYLTGYISNLRIVKGSTQPYSAGSSSITVPPNPLTAITNTNLLTLQSRIGENNNRFVDSSGLNNIITRNGNVTQGTFSPYQKGGWSNYFDGSGDYLSVPSNSAFEILGGSFTIECWIYLTAAQRDAGIVSKFSGSVGYLLRLDTSIIRWYAGSATDRTYSFSTNTWYHIAVVSNGTTGTLYINGIAQGATFSTSATQNTGDTLQIGRTHTTTNDFPGYISNLRILKGTALYTSNFTVPELPLTPVANTSLLTCSSSGLIDSSVNNFTITRNGDVSVLSFTPFKKHNYTANTHSVYFSGSSSYISSPYSSNSAAWYDADFTMEMWVYPITIASSGTNGAPLQVGHGDATTSSLYWSFGYNSSGTPGLYYYNGSPQNFTASGTVASNRWNHIALTHRNSDGQMKMYLNGVDVGTATKIGTPQSSSSYPINIGVAQGTYFNGYISNLRLTKGSIVYTGNFTTPNLSSLQISGTLSTGAYSSTTNVNTTFANTSTSLLTCRDTTIIDNSIAKSSITLYGNVKPSSFNPSGFTPSILDSTLSPYSLSNEAGSVYFDGTGDYLNWTNSAFTFGTGDFTVEAWIYPMGDFGIFGVGGASTGSYGFYYTASTSKFQSTRYGDSAGAGTTTGTYARNQWMHVAAVRSSGTAKIYINGVADSGATYSMGSVTNSGAYTGATWNSASATGYISGLKISNRALYTKDFLIPTTRPIPSNSIFLLDGINSGIIDYTGKNNLETIGNTKISNVNTKYGNTSILFSPGNSSNYLTTPLTPNLKFAAGEDFTIECWIYLISNVAGICALWSNYSSFSSGTLSLFAGHASSSTNQFIIAHNGSFPALSSSTTVNSRVGLWTHIAVVRSSNTIKLYINGTSEGTPISSTVALNGTGTSFWIGTTGDSTSGNPNVYIDDFRITKGVARYTTNFTVPSAPLQTN